MKAEELLQKHRSDLRNIRKAPKENTITNTITKTIRKVVIFIIANGLNLGY